MGLVIPAQEMTISEIRAIREAAINEAVNTLIKKNVVASREECVIRAPVLGSSTSADFRDLDVVTEAASNVQEWIIDGATVATTPGALADILSSGETVNDDTAIVFYGVANLGGDKDWIAVQFHKGAKVLTYWNLEHVHAYNDKILGYSLDFASFGPNETIKIKMQSRIGAAQVAGEDYRWLPIGVLVEPKSKSLAEGT